MPRASPSLTGRSIFSIRETVVWWNPSSPSWVSRRAKSPCDHPRCSRMNRMLAAKFASSVDARCGCWFIMAPSLPHGVVDTQHELGLRCIVFDSEHISQHRSEASHGRRHIRIWRALTPAALERKAMTAPTMDLLTLKEVAEMTRTKESTLRYYRTNGTGPKGAVIGGRLMYRRRDVEAWINSAFDGD